MKFRKMILIITLVLTAILALPSSVPAQGPYPGYGYSYDLNGNRTERIKSNFYIKRGETQEQQTIVGATLIKVYPNPTSGLLRLSFADLPQGEQIEIFLGDMAGKPIQTQKFSSAGEYELDLSDKPNGTYILSIKIGAVAETYKI